MRAVLAITVLAAATLVAVATPAVAKPPTSRQIAKAIHTAEASRSLWATINICNSKRDRNEIGVRGQMPSLGFSSAMYMTIQLDVWSSTTKSFSPIQSANAVNNVTLGSHIRGLEQSGSVFPFKKGQTGLWNATIVFTWKRAGKVIGQIQRTTTTGHKSADYGSPPHYTAAQCKIT